MICPEALSVALRQALAPALIRFEPLTTVPGKIAYVIPLIVMEVGEIAVTTPHTLMEVPAWAVIEVG
jgi:hypothetical protein